MRHFLNQPDEAMLEGSYDTSKLEAVLAALIQEATSLASGSAASTRPTFPEARPASLPDRCPWPSATQP